MGRVPLLFEVGNTKIDATYVSDMAYDAGRSDGLRTAIDGANELLQHKSQDDAEDQADLKTLLQQMDEQLKRLEEAELRVIETAGISSVTAVTFDSGEVGYFGTTACAAAGITYRQLDYWSRTGLVVPRLAYKRWWLYSLRDIVLLKVIKSLLDTGVPLSSIRTTIHALENRTLDELENLTVMTDGRQLFECDNPDQVITQLQSGRGNSGIAIGCIAGEIRTALSAESPPPTQPT